MKNFREEQINSTTEPCINQYWEKDVSVDGVNITFHYWKRKEGYKGYTGKESIIKVVGIKDKKKKRITSVWSVNLGEKYCTDLMLSKFKEI
jgi:hypothetical protein